MCNPGEDITLVLSLIHQSSMCSDAMWRHISWSILAQVLAVIIWTNLDLSSNVSCGTHLKGILQEFHNLYGQFQSCQLVKYWQYCKYSLYSLRHLFVCSLPYWLQMNELFIYIISDPWIRVQMSSVYKMVIGLFIIKCMMSWGSVCQISAEIRIILHNFHNTFE